MADCEAHKVTPELTEIIEAIIISTGYVSNFVQVDYTTGMAHAMYNGFTILPSTEEYHHLHGEVVSYGILVMLTADKQYAERDRLLAFNRSIGLPTHLADIHAKPEDLPAVTEKARRLSATCKSSITPTNCSPSGTGIPEARISSSVRQG